MRLRYALAELSTQIAEALRVLIMQAFLAPAAYWLPKSWALAAANVLSLSLLILPAPGFRACRRMRRLFGGSPYRSFQLAWGWIAEAVSRLRHPQARDVRTRGCFQVENSRENSEAVARLRESGQSFIVATAHFERAALLAVACPRVTPGNYVQVGHATPSRLNSLYNLRLRIQYGTMLNVLSTAWRRPFEFAYTNLGQPTAGNAA